MPTPAAAKNRTEVRPRPPRGNRPPPRFTVALNLAGYTARTDALGLTSDAAVAARTGLDGATIYRIRKGKLNPGPRVIGAFTTHLASPFDVLFTVVVVDPRR